MARSTRLNLMMMHLILLAMVIKAGVLLKCVYSDRTDCSSSSCQLEASSMNFGEYCNDGKIRTCVNNKLLWVENSLSSCQGSITATYMTGECYNLGKRSVRYGCKNNFESSSNNSYADLDGDLSLRMFSFFCWL